MDRRTIILLIAIIIFLFPATAYAEPTVTGPTGLLVNPTADITPVDHMWAGINFIDLDTIILPDQSVEGGTAWIGLLTGGISDVFEVGLGFMVQEESSNGILINAKYQFFPDEEEAWYPALALGGTMSEFMGDRNTSIYVVASKFFWVAEQGYYGGGLHAGLSYEKPEGEDWDLQYFLGADLSLSENLVAIVEASRDEGGFGDGFVYGVRFFFSDTTSGQAGFIDGDLTIGGSFIF